MQDSSDRLFAPGRVVVLPDPFTIWLASPQSTGLTTLLGRSVMPARFCGPARQSDFAHTGRTVMSHNRCPSKCRTRIAASQNDVRPQPAWSLDRRVNRQLSGHRSPTSLR